MFAQAEALAFGKTAAEVAAEGNPAWLVPHRTFAGNRPSNVLIGGAADAARRWARSSRSTSTRRFTQGAVWGINSFDQWGVELGKALAQRIVPELTERRRAHPRLVHERLDRALSRGQDRNGGLEMQLGMVGLGRMGANIVRRLMRDGHECVVFDVSADAIAALEAEGATGARTLEEFVAALESPKVAWVMIPAAITGRTVDQLAALLGRGDIIIDGGNSYYRDDVDRSEALAKQGIEYVDVGTSGGVFGLERGFCLMIGGETQVVEHLDPIFRTLAPGVDAAERTTGLAGEPGTAEHGYLHCGPAGAGHFVKMVHNGIEYGLMAAYAEGLNVLHKANVGKQDHEVSAESTPLRDPHYYRYDLDVAQVAEVWRRGSVVASWLLDLTAHALSQGPNLDAYSGSVSDSGEGRWTVLAAIDESVPVPVLSSALYERFTSRGEATFANQLLSAMRQEFGGHVEQKAPAA